MPQVKELDPPPPARLAKAAALGTKVLGSAIAKFTVLTAGLAPTPVLTAKALCGDWTGQ